METAAHKPAADPSTEEAIRARRAARLRTASDFSSSPAPKIDASMGHQRLVRLLKIALPLLALALVVTMAVYSLLFRPDGSLAISYAKLGREEGEVVMTSARFVGTDKDDQPFEVFAAKARQNPQNQSLVELDVVDGRITLKTGESVRLIAQGGVLDTTNQLLQLAGPIDLTSSNGYKVRTDEIRADLKNGLLSGETPIVATGPFGTISADAFQVNETDRTIRFIGNVTVHFIPDTEEAP